MPDLSVPVPFRKMQLKWTVEHQGGASVEIDLREEQLADWEIPGRLIIEGERAWAGEVTELERSGKPNDIGATSPHRVGWKASGLGLYSRLDKRIVRHDLSVHDDVDVIVHALLSEAQDNQFNGDMGMSMGDRIGTFPSRLKGYCVGVKIGDAINELAQIGRGFDWEVDGDGRLNMWSVTRGTDTGRTLAETQTIEFNIRLSAVDLLTNVTAIADPSDPFGPKYRMSRTARADNYGRREDTIDTDIVALNQKNPNWEQELYDAGHGVLKVYGGGLLNVDATWLSSRAPWSLADVWLQDIVSVEVPAIFGGTQDMRVTDVTVTIEAMPPRPDNGAVLPPIYWITYGFDALVRDLDITDGDPDQEAS